MFECLVLGLLLSLGLFGTISESKKWNKGTCKKTGQPWKLFDRDSQGGRGYISCDEVTWISYPWIDSEFKGVEVKKY